MTKWTPGPWKVVIDDDGNPLSGRPSVFASDELDCGIVHWDGFVQDYWRSARGDKEIHANAHLIAAAPELYEALILALDTIGALTSPHDLHGYGATDEDVDFIFYVLKKARGELE